MRTQFIKKLVLVVGILTLVLGLLFMVRDTTRVFNWTRSGFTLCSIQQARDSTVTFFGVDREDFVSPPYPASGDTILTIGDSTALERRWIAALEVRHTPGREVSITFRHQGAVEQTTIRTRANGPLLITAVVTLQILKLLLFLAFVALGFWVYAQRKNDAAARTLVLYGFAMATYTVTVFLPMYAAMASFQIPAEGWLASVLRTIGIFFGAFWFLLQLHFPRRANSIAEHPWRTYGIIFVPLALITALSWMLAISTADGNFVWLRRALYFTVSTQAIAGFYVLYRNYRRAESNLEKRQTRLVMFGSGLPLLLFLVYLLDGFRIMPNVSGHLPLLWRMGMVDVVFAAILISPISFAYAFGKYRLLEIEGKLRRGTRRIIAMVLLFAAVLCIVYLGNVLFQKQLASGNPLTVVALSAVVIGVIRLAGFSKSLLEKRLYPERQRLRETLRNFLQRSATSVDKRQFWIQLESSLREGLMVDAVYPVISAAGNGTFVLRESFETPFQSDSSLVRQLQTEPHPLMVDEAMAGTRVSLEPAESEWLMKNRVALLLPLITHGKLIGFLGLGHKTEKEDYGAEELRILDSLAPQVALASDNMRLIEENLEKRRLEEQLQLARRVQNGFLPHSVPSVPGMQLAARSSFCLEVAGDYYDIIPRPDGSTVLAVGDVSGKGAGAAMIMANLQAALRTLSTVDLPLSEVTRRINALVYQNTDPDQFVTLFVGLFDPRDRCLRFVNAGHNPPFLLRASGVTGPLSEGGLIIGAFQDVNYTEGQVSLDPGDLLLLYTDGISEANNAQGEELGEKRLCNRARQVMTESPEDVLRSLLALVAEHQDSPAIADDQTLVVARIV